MAEDRGGESNDQLAPVIPLFGSSAPAWRSTWEDEPGDDDATAAQIDEAARGEREAAEHGLTRKLRTRQLSVAEARAVVAEKDLDASMVDVVIQTFLRRGYLDDQALAGQLVRSAVERKGQGRTVIARTLAGRGIPRDVVDAALAELPDDDAERALEFARQKVRSMRGLAHDVALRRLVGQLARRGYGSAALDAARRALDDVEE
ncbi:RecX family transcriptional regulator [Microbacterium protaetiae]|uniref:Regulatory protein RecX n=1 Tax=Microbacterium protaetiae TaxID=2509458 RepID=A0A4V0YDI2_9MICO|nr:regulatory protein RecX [Microbacterium protaetiae]QAY60801.1 RecX family transcriptional regulator [Microbacterium protaetiae]